MNGGESMADIFCDAVARMTFYSVAAGGLPGALAPTLDSLGCLLSVEGNLLDCFVLAGKTRPGPSVVGEVALVFLMPEVARSHLKLGSRIFLQHSAPFAEGEIVELPWMSDYTVRNLTELCASIEVLKKSLEDQGQHEQAVTLADVLGDKAGGNAKLAELRRRLLAMPTQGIFEEPRIKWRIAGALRYVEAHLNAWPSTALR
jgi:hypothetical protein